MTATETSSVVTLAELHACRDAEDYFVLLGVPYEQRVLDVNRLHVLRAFAPALDRLSAAQDGTVPVAPLAEALRAAHEEFTNSSALDHRLFRVLQQRAPRGFVAHDDVSVDVVASDGPSIRTEVQA